jgi:hypothetical protein
MTYGQLLDRARDALGAAGDTAVETNASGHASVAATVAARTRAYEQLIRLVDQISGPVPGRVVVPVAEQLVNSHRRLAATSGGRLLGVGLRAAYVDLPTLTPASAASDTGPVAPHLAAAADHLGIAADLLAGHLGDLGGRPRTPEGRAIAAGAGHRGALADLARLATEMIDVDRRLVGWLARGRPVRTLRPVYEPVTDRLRWWTRSPYPRLLHRVADSSAGESVLRALETAPATERSTGPRPITSLNDVLHTIDTTRAWLEQHPQTTHLAHARAVARLAVTITRGAAASNPPGDPAGDRAEAHRWARIVRRLRNLGELGAGDRDHLVAELLTANDWLHHQLHAHNDAGRATIGGDAAWREALSTLKGRLPALAKQIDGVVAAATTQGQLCVPQAALDMSAPRRGIFMAKAGWRQATPTDHPIETLRSDLTSAARVPADREKALRQALGDPAALARLAFAQPATPGHSTDGLKEVPGGAVNTMPTTKARRSRARG